MYTTNQNDLPACSTRYSNQIPFKFYPNHLKTRPVCHGWNTLLLAVIFSRDIAQNKEQIQTFTFSAATLEYVDFRQK